MNRPSYQAKKEVSSKPALLQAMIDAFRVPDLRFRILFTLGILVIFRFFTLSLSIPFKTALLK